MNKVMCLGNSLTEGKRSEWHGIIDLPHFNGKVIVRYRDKGEIKERSAWYEQGDRRFPQGFSLMPKHLIGEIFEWKKE